MPAPGHFTPEYANPSALRVTGDARGITITYDDGERAFVPRSFFEDT